MTTRREETHEEHRVSGTHVGEPVAHKERKEKGLLEKIFGSGEKEEVKSEHTLREGEVRHGAEARVVKEDVHVVDERHIGAKEKQERVVKEEAIMAPIATRKIVEEAYPQEHVRILEERQALALHRVAEGERRKVIDVKEQRHPVQRKVVNEEEIKAAVERVRYIEERTPMEQRRLVEERIPITAGSAATKTEARGAEVRGAERATHVEEHLKAKEVEALRHGQGEHKVVDEGTRTQAMRRRVLDEVEIHGVVEVRRRIEEIETVEIHRIIEEREPLSKPRLDESELERYRKKYVK